MVIGLFCSVALRNVQALFAKIIYKKIIDSIIRSKVLHISDIFELFLLKRMKNPKDQKWPPFNFDKWCHLNGASGIKPFILITDVPNK
jgi:hypothetical protein